AWGKDAGTQDFIFIHFLPLTNTWVWQIPITDTTTSIGVVTQKRNFARSRECREGFFWACVGSRPGVLERVRGACRITSLEEEANYSYAMRQLFADRLVLTGEAAR